MARPCDHTSVGIVIWNDLDELALIKRSNYPEAIALPAGHCDGDTFLEAAIREAQEETGLTPKNLVLRFAERLDNPCKREDGLYHHWQVFEVVTWSGTLTAGSDAKEVFWVPRKQLYRYAHRTEYFMHKYQISCGDIGMLTHAIFGDPTLHNTDSEWKENPGLEPVWYFILKSIRIL